jgi:hypothetical protein
MNANFFLSIVFAGAITRWMQVFFVSVEQEEEKELFSDREATPSSVSSVEKKPMPYETEKV